ncbi:hypothetical protein CKO28_18160 [Rhodovibrio sodomensis]|uniref:Protoheme IX farnesyltransferase n=1 Tax=Rhodovibrio sodomensis TaxID=1088 RepID=A0ABS1DIP4_9PROT|nr:hypothetical protein [Rhodovibrio sodomensis]MBK1669962.1 hypothetical protein [Rhodovibrio sodomensis]
MAREPEPQDETWQETDWTPETRAAFRRKKRGKNFALLAVLIGFVVVVYIVAIVRMGANTPGAN